MYTPELQRTLVVVWKYHILNMIITEIRIPRRPWSVEGFRAELTYELFRCSTR